MPPYAVPLVPEGEVVSVFPRVVLLKKRVRFVLKSFGLNQRRVMANTGCSSFLFRFSSCSVEWLVLNSSNYADFCVQMLFPTRLFMQKKESLSAREKNITFWNNSNLPCQSILPPQCELLQSSLSYLHHL